MVTPIFLVRRICKMELQYQSGHGSNKALQLSTAVIYKEPAASQQPASSQPETLLTPSSPLFIHLDLLNFTA